MEINEQGKLFVGHLKREVTANHLITYFSSYGKVIDAIVIPHKGTNNSRGFGFVTFEDPIVATTVLDESNHMILQQKVDVKKAELKKNDNFMHSNRDHATISKNKIFVGGLPPNITKEELGAFFENFGTICEVCVVLNKETKRPRGFGFVTFESQETVAKVLRNRFYKLNDYNVEVKIAEPKMVNCDIEIHTYNNNLGWSNGYRYYSPIWYSYYRPCWLCGIFNPTCYYCNSQYPVYDAQSSFNHLEYNGGGQHVNYYGTTQSGGK